VKCVAQSTLRWEKCKEYIIRKKLTGDTAVIGQSMIIHMVRISASRSVEWLVTAPSVNQTQQMDTDGNILTERCPE
jgi:hypothetical protein